MTGEQQGPTIGVRFRKLFALLRAESKKITEEWQEATLARCPFQEGISLGKSQKIIGDDRNQPQMSVLGRCLPCRKSKKMTEERRGPTLHVRSQRDVCLKDGERKQLENIRNQPQVSIFGRSPALQMTSWSTNTQQKNEANIKSQKENFFPRDQRRTSLEGKMGHSCPLEQPRTQDSLYLA